MAFYAITLAGSNYVAPIICGFIAQYQGWQWVFYWPSIFLAFTLVFLFFFMEETNYHRNRTGVTDAHPSPSQGVSDTELEKATVQRTETLPASVSKVYKKKTYLQKLSLLGPRQRKNHMLRRAGLMLYFLSWPTIFYAG